jgi:hypothetical protein
MGEERWILKERDRDVSRKIILKSILKKYHGRDWFHLDQDRDQWWTLVNTLMNLRVP